MLKQLQRPATKQLRPLCWFRRAGTDPDKCCIFFSNNAGAPLLLRAERQRNVLPTAIPVLPVRSGCGGPPTGRLNSANFCVSSENAKKHSKRATNIVVDRHPGLPACSGGGNRCSFLTKLSKIILNTLQKGGSPSLPSYLPRTAHGRRGGGARARRV